MCSVEFNAVATAEVPEQIPTKPQVAAPSEEGVQHSPRRRKQPRQVEFEVPGTPNMLATIRSRVEQFAHTMPFSEDEIEDIKLAVGEASANAIRHGSADNSCKVHVKMERRPRSLKVSIADRGCGFDPASIKPPEPDSLEESGRGIAIMRAVMDKVGFHFTSPGTRVELTKRVRKPSS